jgi:hypothetical protein
MEADVRPRQYAHAHAESTTDIADELTTSRRQESAEALNALPAAVALLIFSLILPPRNAPRSAYPARMIADTVPCRFLACGLRA